ncbi:MAG: hypothetical protein ACHQ1H_05180, partial [Nitrososphaerales archaeon]
EISNISDYCYPHCRHLVDQIVVMYDVAVWRLRDHVRMLEKVTRLPIDLIPNRDVPDVVWVQQSRKSAGKRFDDMHEMARHGMHLSEVLEVSTQSFEGLQKYQASIHESLEPEIGHTHQQAEEYARFQVQCLKSLKQRSESNNQRLQNEIILVNHQ